MPSKHVLANREANSRHTYDVTIWLPQTIDNSNIFIRSREVRDNESRLYLQRYDHMNENERIVHIMSGKMAVRWIKEIAFVYFWIARIQKEICNS